MTEGRCDLILLGWTAFVGFNLISDFLWSGGQQVREGGGAAGSLSGPASSLYRGDYSLKTNGTVVDEGLMRLTLVSQQTSVASVCVSSVSVVLLRPGENVKWSPSEVQSDFLFRGVEFGEAGKLAATGKSDPSRFTMFGTGSCRVDAVLELFGAQGGDGQDSGAAKPWGRLDACGAEGGGEAAFAGAVAGEVAAPECGFSLAFAAEAVDVLYFTQKVVHYSIWVNLLTILQMRFFLSQMRHTDDGPSAAKVSIFCIAIQALTDAYDSFLHLCLGLSSQYMFNTIAVVSLFKFILFSLLEARYMLTIWRQRRHEAFSQGWDSVRRELSWLYSRFYGVLIVGLVLICNNLERLDIIVLVFQAYWVPQIFHDVWQGTRSAIRPAFLIGISVTRALPLLYLWGCPEGIFNGDLYPRLPGAPSPFFCGLVVLIQGVQVAVMLLQTKLGPRWFVPWICMPTAYNYHRSLRVDGETDCVICMSEIDAEDARLPVVTPCHHKFHQTCLEQWMDVKMECPTCRATLPPIL